MMTPRPTPPTLLTLGLVIGAAWLSGGCIETGIRPGDLEEVVSGNPAPVEDPLVVDRVVQVTQPQVDVLFVIDNSGSMRAHQDNLSANFPAFMRTFDGSGLDFHVGVTSTDTNVTGGRCDEDPAALNGRLNSAMGHRWIDETTLNPVGVLQSLATLGTNGSGCERGLAATYRAREEQIDANAGFFRDDAGLHVVVLSDEQDQSDQATPELVPIDDFIDWMEGQRGPNTSVSFSSFVCVASAAPCQAFDLGTRYLDVTDAVGGIVWDINDDIDLGVNAVASSIVANAGFRTLELASTPADPAALEVTIDGVLLDASEYSYDVDSNSVVLTDAAPDGADIVVRWPEA